MDLVTLARTARESLARGLGALQTPGAPPQLMASAEPIANAMSALHRIEGSHGNIGPEVGAAALTAVRQALSQLQSQPVAHPAVDQAMAAIASSLGMVHQLSQSLQAKPSIAPAPPTQPSNAFQAPQAPPPHVAVVASQPYQQPAQPAAQPYQQPVAPPPGWQQPPQAAPQQPAQPAWPQRPQGAPQQNQYAMPTGGQPQYYPPQGIAPQGAPAAAPAPGGVMRVQAELGAHSTTNFYKGLSGNDVIDSGGIFIATYNLPAIGQPLIIKVSLPGGYEFEAQGVVRWTREAPQSGADSPPGFGAQFTQISAEGRQLVYRYVRNREPLFHDDL